jgi:PAS domain-containing protein
LLLRIAYEENPEQFELRKLVTQTALLGDLTMQIGLISADGILKLSTSDLTREPINVGDREYFQILAKGKLDELYISRPIIARGSGKLSILVVRKLRRPDGSFGGVIGAAIDPAFAEQFHRSMKLGEHSGIALGGLDGVIRSSYGFTAPKIYYEKMPEELSDVSTRTPEGYFWGGSVVDGVNRLVSYRIITGYPLILTIGETERHIFAEYNSHRMIYIFLVAVVTLLTLIAVGTSVYRQLALERSKFSLQQTNIRFSAALENMSYGVSMFDAQERIVICNQQYGKIYGLPPELLKTGTPFKDILAHRKESGLFLEERTHDVLSKRRSELKHLPTGEHLTRIYKLSDGRIITITRHPVRRRLGDRSSRYY